MRKAAGFEIEERIITYVIPAEAGISQPIREEGAGRGARPPSPSSTAVIPASPPVIPASPPVIPASFPPVIPVEAGISQPTGEGTAVRPPLPTRGEGWGEGTGRGEAGTVDEEGQSEAPALPPALASQEAYIRQETLSDALHAAPPPPGAYTEEHEIDGATLTVGVVRAR